MLSAYILAAALAAEVPTIDTARQWAATDLLTRPPAEQPNLRYLWVTPWGPTDAKHKWDERHFGSALNFVVQAAVSRAGVIIPGRRTANGYLLAIDLRMIAPKPADLAEVTRQWDGLSKIDPYGPGDSGLVYRGDWFVSQALGPRYYALRGFLTAGKPMTRSEVYSIYGIDEAKSIELNGDQRSAKLISDLTGSARRVDRMQGPGGRHNTGSVWQTFDIKQNRATVDANPFYNVLELQRRSDGGEAIIEQPNGTHAFILYGSDGRLVAQADPNIATDYSGPAGSPALVTAAHSCIRCHGGQGGLWPVENDIAKLVASGTDILGDFSTDKISREQIDRIAGLYLGNFSKRLILGRSDYGEAVRRSTFHPDFPQGIGTAEASKLISAIYDDYTFGQVDASQACLELGYKPGPKPIETLQKILPPQAIRNPIASALKAGLAVRRRDWETIYRAAFTIAKERK